MARKYSLAQLTVLGWTPPEMIYNAHLIGYDCVGLRTIAMGVKGETIFDLYDDKGLFERTAQALKDTGVTINDIELAKIDDNTDLMKFERAFEAAAKLNVKHVISSIWTENKDYRIETFAALCDLAAKYGITVNLEFVTWASVSTLKGVLEILDAVNKKNAAVMVDTLHFYRSRVALEELDSCPAELFKMAHICDGPKEIPTDKEGLIFTGRDARYYVGEGAIDIASIIKHLPDSVVLSVELPHLEKVAKWGYVEHARRCLVTAKDYMRRNGIDDSGSQTSGSAA